MNQLPRHAICWPKNHYKFHYKFHSCAAGGAVTLDEAKFQAHFHFDVHEGCAGEQDAKGRWGIPRDGWISLLEGVFWFQNHQIPSCLQACWCFQEPCITYERHQKLSLSLLHILWCFDLPPWNSKCLHGSMTPGPGYKQVLLGSIDQCASWQYAEFLSSYTTEANDACDVGPMATAFGTTRYPGESAMLNCRLARESDPRTVNNHTYIQINKLLTSIEIFRNRCRKAAEVKVTRPVKPEVDQLRGKDRVSGVVWHGMVPLICRTLVVSHLFRLISDVKGLCCGALPYKAYGDRHQERSRSWSRQAENVIPVHRFGRSRQDFEPRDSRRVSRRLMPQDDF